MSQAIKHNGWTLFHKGTDKPVIQGTVVAGREGDKYPITGGRPPHKPSSSGRVFCGDYDSFFPHVFDMEWRQDV